MEKKIYNPPEIAIIFPLHEGLLYQTSLDQGEDDDGGLPIESKEAVFEDEEIEIDEIPHYISLFDGE